MPRTKTREEKIEPFLWAGVVLALFIFLAVMIYGGTQ